MLLLRRRRSPLLNAPLLLLSPLSSLTPSSSSSSAAADNPTDAKLISTAFLLFPDRLTLLRHLITPSVAILSLRRLSNPSSALALLRLLSSGALGGAPPPGAYFHVIALFFQSNLFADALNLLDEMIHRDQRAVDPSFLDSLLASCVRAGDLETSLQLIGRAVKVRCGVRSLTFNNLLNLLISRNQAQDAIVLFVEHSRSQLFIPDTCGFNSIINACCRMGDIASAFRFFKEMGDFGCVPDTITHNVLIAGLCKANQVDRGWEILSKIRFDSSCLPNVKTYTSVISGYCKLGKMDVAAMVFSEMVEIGIRPSRVTYNVLIDGYGRVRNLQSAVSMYERMRGSGCPPDVVTFTSLIHGYCRSGKLDAAIKFLHEMRACGVRPNGYTYSIIIESLCKKNRLKEASDLLKELNARKDIVARAFIYNPLIDGFCKAGNVEEANSIFVEMEEKGCRPDKYTYTILIIGHCMRGRMSEAIGLFNRMMATGCAPDAVAVNNFVSLLLKAGKPGEARRVMAIASEKDMGLPLKDNALLSTKRADISVAA